MNKLRKRISVIIAVFVLVGAYLAYPISNIGGFDDSYGTVYAAKSSSKPKSSGGFSSGSKSSSKPKTSTIKPDSGSFSSKPKTDSNSSTNKNSSSSSSSSSSKNYNDYDDYGGKSYVPRGGIFFGGYNPFYRMAYGFGINPFIVDIVTILVILVILYIAYDYFKNKRNRY